ncbi:amidohydrolase family protein [Herbiconiux sp. CPCC 203407]|uniref:Amidohydrolase family protein n=1 Tax=Herbiconiux oxytropis TaxID=2970915 RepID=A0AA42BVK4_9MICO|nr:amidohydrolase family protein [Herbiconiux oxytropis]MCS5723996.1 amidohydrolase family protein [Herbiconiux oxytropis]MCS5726574.1 amidohydrolase family protein [Herbiconiux oxytropis]
MTARAAAGRGTRRSIVDAHAHVWDRARTPIDWIDESLPEIDRDFSVAELHEVARAAATAHGVEFAGGVLVQALNDSGETADLLRAARGPVVGWADLDAPGLDSRLAELRQGPGGHRLAGLRHLAHVDPDPEWLLRPQVSRGLDVLAASGLVFDLVLRPWQLELAARVAADHPDVLFVLDHLGQPPGAAARDEVATWERDLRTLADLPNMVAKISGIAVRGDRARLERLGGFALDAFGADRLMFGSDWPLVRLADDYGSWLGDHLAWSAALSPDEQLALDSATARRTYGATT